MAEFWEESFKNRQTMWGFEPADCAITTVDLFLKNGFKKILIPGFGYGRNAKIFTDNGFHVTGIEISKTAIDLAKKHYGDNIQVYHGGVDGMPFDKVLYDGIFCYALIHLLNEKDRIKLINDCYNQLKLGGYMVFVAISKSTATYGEGKKTGKDTFETKHGVELFFYDDQSVHGEFGEFGLIETREVSELAKSTNNMHAQKFWKIVCKKV